MNIKIFRFRMKTLKQIGVGIESNKEYKFYAFIFWLFIICCSIILITWVYAAIYGDFYRINNILRDNYVYSLLIFFMVSIFLIFNDNLLNCVISQINHNTLKHFFALVIFLMNIAIVPILRSPFIYHDEAGYWAHAATLAGFDWSGITSLASLWYSYGYSFILWPLFKITSNFQLAYKLAVTINSLFIVITYYITIYILIKIYNFKNNILAYFLSATAVLYTSYQIQSSVTWTETFLLLVFSLILYCLVYFISNKTISYFIYTILLLGILFMIHHRTIGILFAFFLTGYLLAIDKIISNKHIYLFAIVIFLILLFDYNITEYLVYKENISLSNELNSIFIKKFIKLTSSFDDFKLFICLFISQLFSFIISSNIIGFFFVMICIVTLVNTIFNRFYKYKLIYSQFDPVKYYVYIFISLSFIIMIVIQCTWFIDYTRYDQTLYTRYYDFITGYLIIFGIMEYSKIRKNISLLLIFIILFLLMVSPKIVFYLDSPNKITMNFFHPFCAPTTFFNYKYFGLNFKIYSYISVVILSIFLFFHLLFKKILLYRKNIVIILLCVLNIIYYTYISIPAKHEILHFQNTHWNDPSDYNKFKMLDSSYNFYAYNDVWPPYLNAIQFRLFNKKLNIIDKKSNIIPQGYIICRKGLVDDLFFLKVEESFGNTFILSNKSPCAKNDCLNDYLSNIPQPFYGAIFKSGWYSLENNLIWSSGKATLLLPKPKSENTDWFLTISNFSASPNTPITVIFRGGKEMTAWERKVMLHDAALHEIRLPIDKVGSTPYEIIDIEVPEATSPKAKGVSEDTRELGIALMHIDVIPNLPAPVAPAPLLDPH